MKNLVWRVSMKQALRLYAKKELTARKTILTYASILDEKEAAAMLEIIQSSKHKDIEVDLPNKLKNQLADQADR
jgi:hypothetical protein